MAKKKFGPYTYTEAEFNRMYDEATKRGKEALETEPRAVAARYDKKSNRMVIDLVNGATIAIPCDLIQGLSGASPADIAEVELTPFGLGLHWETLDQDFSVAGLVSGIFGTKAWMAELGRRGGVATSNAKAKASRANGKKGGRPKKARVQAVGH